MSPNHQHRLLGICIATVWLANGLLCKVMNLVPRHQRIVQEILALDGPTARASTVCIGVSEILMAAWVLSRYKPKLCALTQMGLVATMNVLEFFLAPELLLWGKFNALFALLFIGLVYYQGFVLARKINPPGIGG